ncbi:MAG: hypothetical protein NVS9B15_15480 [Acidobacteriaceae bacterium]
MGQWFEKNHESVREIWIVFYKKTARKSGVSYREAVSEALRYGWIDGQMKTIDSETYAIRFTPRRPKSNWSASNRELARSLLKEGRMTPSGQKSLPDDLG